MFTLPIDNVNYQVWIKPLTRGLSEDLLVELKVGGEEPFMATTAEISANFAEAHIGEYTLQFRYKESSDTDYSNEEEYFAEMTRTVNGENVMIDILEINIW